VEIVKLLIDGFVSEKIYSFPPKVKLDCLTNYGKLPLDFAKSDEIKKFIKERINAANKTLFNKIYIKYMDVVIYNNESRFD
jgi:hypothetical protein